MNLGGGLQYLVETIFELYLYIVIARFVLQMVRGDFYNPFSQFIVKATSPLLMPLRKVIPGFGRVDVASIVLFALIVMVEVLVLSWLFSGGVRSPLTLVFATVMIGIRTIINFFLIVVFISVIMSWVAQGYSPFGACIQQMAGVILNPIRRLLPPAGGMDFSPLIAGILLMFLKLSLGV